MKRDTRLHGLRIGHWHDLKRGTGVTVVLLPEGNVTSGLLLGRAPGTREFALLHPTAKVEEVNAVVFTGGSAMGLNSTHGVLRYLRERNVGYKTPYGNIPIVVGAVIFDLPVGDRDAYPSEQEGYRAASAAVEDLREGNVGVGVGATVGKWMGLGFAMKGGWGVSVVEEEGLFLSAMTVTNSLGDILTLQGKVLAGARHPEGGFWGEKKGYGIFKGTNVPRNNTTLSVVVTNLKLSKLETYILAKRASLGLVRAIRPLITSFDGDIVIAVSLEEMEGDKENLYERAQDVVADSVRRSVIYAKSSFGIPGFG